jgi:hypothetical protein
MAQVMDLKKFRQFNAHDVIELYSTNEAALTKGTIVEYVSASPDTQNGFGPGFANVPNYAWSADYEVKWKVQAAPSGSRKVAGMLLKEVVQYIFDPWQVDARFAPEEKLAEKQVIPSGRAVPIVTKGFFEVTGYDTSAGYPGAGSGAYVSNSGGGIIAVGNRSTTTDGRPRVGTFMTSSGLNGAALLELNIVLNHVG